MKKITKTVYLVLMIAGTLSTFNSFAQIVTGSGTSGFVTKFTAASIVGNSTIRDNGTNVGIGMAPNYKLDVNGIFHSSNFSCGDATSCSTPAGLGNGVVYIGCGAGASTVSGYGSGNIAIGVGALTTNQKGSNNTVVGTNALNLWNDDVFGGNNAYGTNALASNVGGSENNAFGVQSQFYSLSSFNNSFGNLSLGGYPGGSGGNNDAFGYSALYSNTTGSENCAFGFEAGYSNTIGVGCAGFGYMSLNANTANYSTAMGWNAMLSNVDGSYNTGLGSQTLYTNVHGVSNTAVGYATMFYNNGGSYNTAVGHGALVNGSGSSNTAMGFYALSNISNTSATSNVAIGYYAGATITTGASNVAMGYYAGGTNLTTGSNNTLIGNQADVSSGTTLNNQTAIGSGAINNQAASTTQIGNTTANKVYVAPLGSYNVGSDGRFKTNITENVKGLAFINKLRPVTYNVDAEKFDDFLIQGMPDSVKTKHKAGIDFTSNANIKQSGFIAQEVANILKSQNGFGSTIVSIPADSNVSSYAINYAEFVVPLVKAVQELSHKVDSLMGVTQGAGQRQMQNNGINTGGTNSTPANATSINNINVQLSNANVVVLNQNQPNPFAEQTVITYNIPSTANAAQILFYDINGKQIQSVTITTFGAGQLNVYANDLTSGMYSYTLIVDGKVIDTKKMIKQ